ncbi:hypothetical protein [Legionella impletisoli]|uniref:Uncharacterized protein n=1 Tax=Legionella impletisoli TaxID=343510 RepID=A0A917JWZ8_9GAMM|nr:hypothetical protein [Legionella impletisoli]GGI88134.1 hypothetical protein GCM10007966_16080 [Legionella impletisoli]
MNKAILVGICVIGGLFFCQGAYPELDNLQSVLLSAYETPLRWDNIEGPPAWVSGTKPIYSPKLGMHLVTLHPGQSVKVRVSEQSRLRVFSPCQSLSNSDLAVDTSNGSGLYAKIQLIPSTDKHSLVSSSAWYKPKLFIISRPIKKKTALQIGLFASRYEYLPEIAPYRNLIPLCSKKVFMGREIDGGQQPYWLLEPGVEQSLSIKGPARLAFENRMAYPPFESSLVQTYHLKTKLDNKPFKTLEFVTSEETSWPVKINGQFEVVGRLERGFLDIPSGNHTLELQSSVRLIGRLLKQQNPDYLFPALNGPRCPPTAASNLINQSRPDLWDMNASYIKNIIAHPNTLPAKTELVAQRIIRDNARKAGGILGVMVMQRYAALHQNYPLIQEVADELFGYHTFYRTVNPTNKNPRTSQYFAWFLPKPLHNFGFQGKGLVAAEQFLNALLERISSAEFVGLPTAKAEQESLKHRYYLSKRPAPIPLRVVVDPARTTPGALFFIQFNNQKPIPMHVTCNPELPWHEYALIQGQAGKEMLAQLKKEHSCPTLSGPFSQWKTPGPLILANTLELTLPMGVQVVKAWKADDKKPVSLAIQYRASDPFVLSETSYWAAISQLPPGVPIIRLLQNHLRIPHASDLPAAEKTLQNHWLPLIQFIQSRYKQFSAPIRIRNSKDKPIKPSTFSPKEIAQQRQQAQQFERRLEWLPALELWSKLSQQGSGNIQNMAKRHEIEALYHLGEHYLAETKLRSYLLYGDASIRIWAYQKLLELYKQQHAIEEISTLTAAMMMIKPEIGVAKQLIEALLAENEPHLALMVGLTLPEPLQPTPVLLRAAYQSRWWGLYSQLARKLPTFQEQQFWHALRRMEQTKFKEALALFTAAGSLGKPWKEKLLEGCAIRQQINSFDPKLREQGVRAWEYWQANQPSDYLWKNEDSIIQDYANGYTLYSIERDLYSQAYEGTKNRPVKMHIIGPVKVRLEIRPMHQNLSYKPLDGWFYIYENKTVQPYAITNNFPSEAIKIIGKPNGVAGQRFFIEFELGPGPHTIKAGAGALSFLLRPYLLRPEIPIPILPILNSATRQAALQGGLIERNEARNPCFFYHCITAIKNKSECTQQKTAISLCKERCRS